MIIPHFNVFFFFFLFFFFSYKLFRFTAKITKKYVIRGMELKVWIRVPTYLQIKTFQHNVNIAWSKILRFIFVIKSSCCSFTSSDIIFLPYNIDFPNTDESKWELVITEKQTLQREVYLFSYCHGFYIAELFFVV